MTDTILQLQDVGKILGDRWVLRGVNLQLQAGESLALTGANGAGKTTLIRIVAGLYRRSQGSMARFGKKMPPEAAADRRIGVLESANFCHPAMTLEENLRLTARLWNIPNPDTAVHEAIRIAELEWCRHDRIGIYSRGMQQRAGLARLLVQSPRLWVVDEPWQGLDSHGQAIFRGVLERALQGGGAVLAAVPLSEGTDRVFGRQVRLEGGVVVAESSGGAGEDW